MNRDRPARKAIPVPQVPPVWDVEDLAGRQDRPGCLEPMVCVNVCVHVCTFVHDLVYTIRICIPGAMIP